MRRVLVTGGSGFIGSHLIDALLARGDKVVCVDNFATGRRGNIETALANPSFILVEADINDRQAMDAACAGVEHLFHVAALADIVPSIEKPVDYFRANVDGTFTVVEAARAAGVGRIVYVASSSCYGIPDMLPTLENAEARPQYPYALTKYLGEQIVLHWAKVYGLPAVSLRFFNVFGPRARTSGTYGAVFGVFLAQKLAAKPFTVVGDGTQTRDFTYVSDIVSALIAAAESDVCGEAINIGSGGTYSVNRLVELLGGEIVYVPKRPGEPDCTFADIAKARRLLQWSPRVTFEDGVAKMLEQLEDWRAAPVWEPDSVEEATRTWFRFLGEAHGARAISRR